MRGAFLLRWHVIASRLADGYVLPLMNDVTQLLSAIEQGDPHAAGRLLPLVYDELRRLAAAQMAREKPGQTLDATGLVHEAYLRLVGSAPEQPWDGRGHFFAAAARAMLRILVENARHKRRTKHGGGREREELSESLLAEARRADDLVALDEALAELAAVNPQAADLVQFRYFVGLTNREAAELLAVSPRKADQIWAYARAWLLDRLGAEPQ
jgi:RNA polymerase sigma factor (TIGR02999 family)